jgi:hypothetical protein
MGKWKFLKAGSRESLFDLESKEQENKNLIEKYPDLAKKMKGNLEIWKKVLLKAGIYEGKVIRDQQFYDFYFKD